MTGHVPNYSVILRILVFFRTPHFIGKYYQIPGSLAPPILQGNKMNISEVFLLVVNMKGFTWSVPKQNTADLRMTGTNRHLFSCCLPLMQVVKDTWHFVFINKLRHDKWLTHNDRAVHQPRTHGKA